MRRLGTVSYLLTTVISAGILGGISTGHPTRAAAEFRATSASAQTITLIRSATQLANNDATANLIPAPYRIAAAQAVDYAATLRGEITGNPRVWKALFSPKMLALLSSRWDDTPDSLPGLFGQSGDMDPEDMDTTNDSSAEADDATQSASQSSALYDWLLGDWSLPNFTDSNFWDFTSLFGSHYDATAPAQKTDAGSTRATPSGSAPQSNRSAHWLGTNCDALDRFVLDDDAAFRYSPEYNGSFGYPHHFAAPWSLPRMTTIADAALPTSARENAHLGYREEQYSIKYGEEVNEGDFTDDNASTPAIDGTDETAATPQSNQNATNAQREFADYLSYYLGTDATVDPLTPISIWIQTAPSSLEMPTDARTSMTIFDPCAAAWRTTFATSISTGQNEFSTHHADGTGNASEPNDVNDEAQEATSPDDDTASARHTLLQHFGFLMRDEANRWSDAFHRTLVQFSLVRGVF